jgi:hypothetical protein
MNAKSAVLSLSLAAMSAGAAFGSSGDDPWEPYKFLVGEWVGEGSGDPGKGSGQFSFAWDLQGKVLVRRNRADFPAAGGRPAVSHEDLMIIYRPDRAGPPKAIYFDSESHVINYQVTVSNDGKTVTFLSDATAAAPGFRFTYARVADDSMKFNFAIAPPGQPGAFKTHIEGGVHRATGAAAHKGRD